ncbi:MAG TPA: trypsin-like peptidase domain-containing protein [Cellulomonas sp.]
MTLPGAGQEGAGQVGAGRPGAGRDGAAEAGSQEDGARAAAAARELPPLFAPPTVRPAPVTDEDLPGMMRDRVPTDSPGTSPVPGRVPPDVARTDPDVVFGAPLAANAAADAAPEVSQPGGSLRRRGRRRRATAGLVVGGLVLAFLAGVGGGLLGARLTDDDHLADAGLPLAVSTASADRAADSVAGIAAQVLPSVVSIELSTAEGVTTGSGVVLRQDGYILTNHHVVADADTAGATLVVLLADGSQESASVVGSTADYDLAVVKIDVTGLTPLLLGDSDAVQVGDPVVAVGAPLGLAGTVTSGIVSALNRPVAAGDGVSTTAFINAIQTDAAINPGNSGGPLVNAAGEVIGINSAIAQASGVSSSSGGSIGLGFAIPSNQARRTAEQLIETGVATYPVIGVLLDASYTGEGVQVFADAQDGVLPVTPGGPADLAGIRAGDVIVSIDGRPVTDSDELVVAIRARTPGDAVLLRVRTGDDERDVRVVLQESEAD